LGIAKWWIRASRAIGGVSAKINSTKIKRKIIKRRLTLIKHSYLTDKFFIK
jgi:hypothetical protein